MHLCKISLRNGSAPHSVPGLSQDALFGIREVDLVEEALEVKTGKVLELRRDINGDGGQRRRGATCGAAGAVGGAAAAGAAEAAVVSSAGIIVQGNLPDIGPSPDRIEPQKACPGGIPQVTILQETIPKIYT